MEDEMMPMAERLPPFPNPPPPFTWQDRMKKVILILSSLEYELEELEKGPQEATARAWQEAYGDKRHA